jgi:argininosuccinate lyase
MTTNLPSGYHRDLQLLKEHLFPAFGTLRDCVQMMTLMLENSKIEKELLANDKYKYLFSVEEVNKLVLQGVPFRDAYKQVGQSIEEGSYQWSTQIQHTHEGSIGNLCTEQIKLRMEETLRSFPFESVHQAIRALLA